MNSKFKLLNKTYDLIEYIDERLVNYNKKMNVLKNKIEACMYELLENLFAYNINTNDRIKEKYLKDYLVKLSMLDFYIRVSFERRQISVRNFEVIGRKIVELRKITYGLMKNENKEDRI